ncbi:MBL fold metallo-hydrolase [Mycolicibacterium mengxianglii]|uniref:MBL fold metallo-hydrolase n=1 Tax=Mycolicibacterium mengxianglii TaxID=2736649 RepID=UPI0018EF0538|nr:MBL fold metallo-hydrolase [Mycolicibacterium mengxianglii]
MLITGFAAGPGDVNCYLVANGPGAAALVIDPGDEAVATLEYFFAANGLTPAAVLLTHGHASHAASAFDLGVAWDIPTYLHPADRCLLAELGAEQPEMVVDVHDGDDVSVADIVVAVDHTPGHTAGSVVFRLTADTDEGPVPVVFSGDTLLNTGLGVGDDCGGDPEQQQQLRSVATKLMVLDDRTVVLPGHGPSTTIGACRRSNPKLQEI